MATPYDNRMAHAAEAHIHSAMAAPHRKELELTQAENYARLIADPSLKRQILEGIRLARLGQPPDTLEGRWRLD